MSVIRTCIRMIAVSALRDRTWAGTNIQDSKNLPINDVLKDAPTPYIGVFTDDDDRIGEGMQADGAGRTINLVIESGVAAAIQQTEGGSGPSVSIPADTDSSYELIIDSLERQILYALLYDSESKWGLLFRMFYTSIDSVESKRGASSDTQGERWAARQLIFKLKAISDPVAGQVVSSTHPVNKFLTAARAASDNFQLTNVIPVIEAMLPTAPLPSWRLAMSWMGLGTKTVRHIGIAPAILEGSIEAPVLTEVDPVQVATKQQVPPMEEFLDLQQQDE